MRFVSHYLEGVFGALLVASSASLLSSSAAEENANGAQLNTGGRCGIHTEDIGHPVTTAEDVDLLVDRYLGACFDQLDIAIGRVYAREQRDAEWALPLEEKVKQATSPPIQGTTIKGECRTSLCRYDIKLSGTQSVYVTHIEIARRLFALVNNTPLEVHDIYYSVPGGFTIYFYSTVNPRFAEPLRAEMEGRAAAGE